MAIGLIILYNSMLTSGIILFYNKNNNNIITQYVHLQVALNF